MFVAARTLPATLRAALPDGQTLPAEQFAVRHRTLVRVLWAHVLALPVLALAYGSSVPHALLEAVILGVWPFAATRLGGARMRGVLTAIGLLTCSAVLVHVTDGLIEAHFHFFVAVTALSLYEDWPVYGIAVGYVLLHHGAGPALGGSVFTHDQDAWAWAGLHSAFILALCVANVSVWRASERVREELAQAHEELARRARELERSNGDLQEFAYAASHDLSEPLRSIAGYLQLLERRYGQKLDADADQYIGYAVDGAVRMRALIDDMLAYSRVEGAQTVPEEVDLRATIAVVVRELAPAIEEAGATVDVRSLPTVEGDPVQLAQLVQNLLANAVKFRHPERTPRVIVSAVADGPGHRITVADNGIGIEPERAEEVFGMFQRLHGREAYAGTGIGLAICRKIVERHGGAITAAPNPGGGTRMEVWLPAAPAVVADLAVSDGAGVPAPAH